MWNFERNAEHVLPADIERTSIAIISEELENRGICLDAQNAAVIKRVIHDGGFDYAKNLPSRPAPCGLVSRRCNWGRRYHGHEYGEGWRQKPGAPPPQKRRPLLWRRRRSHAKGRHSRAPPPLWIFAAAQFPNAVFAVGNAPTALWPITAQIERGLRWRS